jgi:hypothetical protein
MNRTFDFYEYAGVIIPGAVLILGLIWLFPESRALFSKEGVTFGELGLFIIVAYAAGQLVQGIGNAVEWLCWRFLGLPSTRVLTTGAHISADQHRRLLEAVRADFGTTEGELKNAPSSGPLPVVREVYAAVSEAKRATRVDTFLGNYGLARGLAAALLVLIAFTIPTKGIIAVTALVFLFVLALQRMYRYGRHYATELFVQYLALKANKLDAT